MTRSKGKIPTKVTYLEMHAESKLIEIRPEISQIQVIRAEKPTVSFARYLYDAVGKNYTWTGRKLLTDQELASIIHHTRVETHVLYVRGTPAGYIELDGRVANEVEIAYFGILPEFHGLKLGPYLLHWAIHYVWKNSKPKRFWLHTCALDHPKALQTYIRAGFQIYKEQTEWVDILDEEST